MTRTPPPREPHAKRPRESALAPATVSLFTLGLQELRKDVMLLLESGWPEPVRRRAEELATALWEAAARQQMSDFASIARSLASLAALAPDKAAPLRPQLRDKFGELFDAAGVLLQRLAGRNTG